MTITEFLLARIAEDEAVARAATQEPWYTTYVPEMNGGPYGDWIVDSEKTLVAAGRCWDDRAKRDTAHIARHDPARALAECAAKRAIIELREFLDRTGGTSDWHSGYSDGNGDALKQLATIYANHPDYQSDWLA